MNNSPKSNRPLLLLVIILCVTQIISICGLGVLWIRSNQKPESLVVINYDDPFIAERVKEFDLPQVIMQYDQVVDAIEKFYQDKGYYPQDLKDLTPIYLSKVPGIYIRNGEKLTYSPEPSFPDTYILPDTKVAPFTFNIYGHYTGLAFMHGWFLMYCPSKYDYCNDSGDRHMQTIRINDQWIWINSSAL
jgi:hypothetical protein